LTKYIFEKLNFSTNNIFLVKIAKITMACHWVPYYSGYKVLEIPQHICTRSEYLSRKQDVD
jgi:hypothetical protein